MQERRAFLTLRGDDERAKRGKKPLTAAEKKGYDTDIKRTRQRRRRS